ncbi:hypothetical protein AHAS_Ahas16G0058800 [Arachis hypogaea]
MIIFCSSKFFAIFNAALTTTASATNGKLAAIVEFNLERRFSVWSLNTAAVASAECASTNATSILHSTHPARGGLQVTLLHALLSLIEVFVGYSAISANSISISLSLCITVIGLGLVF